MNEKDMHTILEALAERIRELKVDIMLKDVEIERLRKKNEELQAKITEIERKIWGEDDAEGSR